MNIIYAGVVVVAMAITGQAFGQGGVDTLPCSRFKVHPIPGYGAAGNRGINDIAASLAIGSGRVGVKGPDRMPVVRLSAEGCAVMPVSPLSETGWVFPMPNAVVVPASPAGVKVAK